MSYKAFISYSHQDSKWATWLHRSLERYRIDPKIVSEFNLADGRLYPVFRDRSDLGTSPSLPLVIKEALSQSDSLIVICSPASANSAWVNEEAKEFIQLGKRDRIIFVLVDGEDSSNCFPPCLADDEPLAADVRDHADGKFNALLKVISGMLQIPYDVLGQRELHRRRRQLVAVISLALIVTTVTSSLALMALFARQDAERRLQQSENLISFMLEDLRGRLEPLGKLELLDAVGVKAMAYFASLMSEDVDHQTLVKHAIALRQIGEVRSKQGHVDTALNAFRESLSLLEDANRRESDNLEVLFQLAQTRFWIADVHYQRLDYGAAREEIARYRDLAVRMFELEPLNVDHQMEVAFAENNLGTLAFQTNQPIRAKEHFLKALSIKQDLLGKDPQNRKLRGEITITMSWIGSVESRQGNMTSAIDWHERQITELEALLQQDTDIRYREKLALAHRRLGEDLFRSNQAEMAEIEERKTVAIYRDLVAHDSENAIWRSELYTSLLKLAQVQLAGGETAEIDVLLREANQGLDRELSVSPNNGRLLRERATVDICWAKLKLLRGEPAEEYAMRAMGRLRDLIKEPYDVDVHHEFARAAYILMASYQLTSTNNPGGSLQEKISEVTSEALAVLDQLQANETETIALRALLLASAGLEDEARQVIDRVLDTEYRAPEYLNGSPLRVTLYGAK
jgi:tetratricopeptide (TPR) repeat protein